MKKLCCFVSLLLLLSQAHAQTDIEHDNRVHPLLRQAINKTSGLLVYGRYNGSMLVNMAVLNTTSHTLSWFTCHGRFFDSARLTGEEYRAITTKAIDPFTLYQDMCSEELAIVKAAKNIYRVYGLKRALQSTDMNYRAVFASQEVQKAKTPLEKLMAMDNIQKGFLLQQAYIRCPAPFQLQNNPALNLINSQPGKMLQTKDSTVYYNIDPLASTNKIILYKHTPGKLYVFNRQYQLTDSVWLQPGKYNLLLKEKTDVFLLYRGWLEMQLQEATNNAMQLIKNHVTEDTATTLYRYAFEQDDATVNQALRALYRRINAIETKIDAAIRPATAAIEQAVYNLYRNDPSEISYAAGMGVGYTFTEVRGRKVYELTNHLGNVLATVSDRRKAISINDSTVDHYEPVVIKATDYYAFGMQMPGRTTNDETYRYGFNGKENDNEVKGEGNQQDYGMRIYDPRLGRFLSVDPISKNYPELTPYQFASNRPIDGVDQDGLEFKSKAAELAYFHRDPVLASLLPVPQTAPQAAHATMVRPTPRSSNSDNTYVKLKPVPSTAPFIQPEKHIAEADIFGNGHIGPESVVKENIASIKQNYYSAIGENIAGGPFGSAGYLLYGDRGSFAGAVVDQIGFSLAGVPEDGGYLSKPKSIIPTRFIPSTQTSVEPILKSFDDVVANPKALWGKSADEIGNMLGPGWERGTYGSEQTGWKFIQGDKSIFYHPGGGRHEGSYYGFSSGKVGKNKVVGSDYVPLKGDKATIIKINEANKSK